MGVVSVVGLRVAPGGVQRGDANARSKRLATRDVGGRCQRRLALDGNLLRRGGAWRRRYVVGVGVDVVLAWIVARLLVLGPWRSPACRVRGRRNGDAA